MARRYWTFENGWVEGPDEPNQALDIRARTSTASINVVPTVSTSASTSVGGAVAIDNSANTGLGLRIYSTQASPSGRLFSVRANSATFNQNAAVVEQAGTGTGLFVNQTNVATFTGVGGTGLVVNSDSGGGSANAPAVGVNLTGTGNANAVALNVTSANAAHSTLQVSGVETGRGTIKVSHTGTGSDGNASAISLDLKGTGTAAQGILIDATEGGTTGKLLNLRNNGAGRLSVAADGHVEMYEQTAPASPAANTVRIFCEDNGSGKTRLMVIFPTGVKQQIAIEP